MSAEFRNSKHALDDLAKLALVLGDGSVASDARALSEQLERRELNLFVVGQFKRGKSTVVNALIEEDLMPTGALPLTGVATAIRYGETASIVAHLTNGITKEITSEELAIYVSERTNPKNAMGVQRIDVFRPIELLARLALFDTPGVGSINEHNTNAARSALPRADAAILVVGPEPPIGAEELAYAREVAESAVQLFVVFNKADIAGTALPELVEFTRKALHEAVGEEFIFFTMSALRARSAQTAGDVDSEFGTFTGALHEFVARYGFAALEQSARRKAHSLLYRTDALLQLRERAMDLPKQERLQRRTMAETAIRSLDDRVRLLELAVDDDVRQVRKDLDAEIDRLYDRDLSAFQAAAPGIAAERSRALRKGAIEQLIRTRANSWRQDAIALSERKLQACVATYVRLLGELEDAVIRAGCEALHVDPGTLEPRDVKFEPAKLTASVSLDPSTGLEMLRDAITDILPRASRVAFLERQIRNILASELDAIRGRLRYGIAQDLEPWRRATRKTIVTALESTRTAVLSAFAEPSDQEEEIRLRRELGAHRQRLQEIRADLETSGLHAESCD